jgi:predicted dehydrogenase
MLKVGLVGAGAIAQKFHLPAWEKIPGAQVVCLADSRGEAVREVADKFGITKVYQSIEEMMKHEQLDIVDICSPNALHAEHTLVALEHNVHVVVEKPLTTNAKDVQAIMAKAAAKKKKVMCAHHQRFRPVTVQAKKIIENGDLGEIYYVSAQGIKSRGVPVQNGSFTNIDLAGGGPLMDLGSHLVDVSWWLMGRPLPVRVRGNSFSKLAGNKDIVNQNGPWQSYSVEDFFVGDVYFDNGAILHIETSYLLNSSRDYFGCEFFGDKKGLLWPQLLVSGEDQNVFVRKQIEFLDDKLASVEELKHFVDSIQNDREPLVTLNDSLTVVSIIEALYESARLKNDISLPERTEC